MPWAGADLKHDLLQFPAFGADHLAGSRRTRTRGQHRLVGSGRLTFHQRTPSMGALWPESPPVVAAPVAEVVLTLPARTRPVGDLVPGESVLHQHLVGEVVLGSSEVRIRCRNLATPDLPLQGGAAFHPQAYAEM